jgi:uncharacterized protein (DUF433 family)
MDWPTLPPSPYLDIHAPDNVRVRGTRIDICLVVEEYLEGRFPEETVLAYPTLELAQIYGVIAYYLEHRESVDQYVAVRVKQARELERAYREGPEPPIVKRLKAMRAGKAA